jgi:hypothetical protein
LIDEQIHLFPQEDIDLLTHRNACALYRHPLPADATKWLEATGNGSADAATNSNESR